MVCGGMSQSLVNEGRFPQLKGETVTFYFWIDVSQSLVNEGRFPQEKVQKISKESLGD